MIDIVFNLLRLGIETDYKVPNVQKVDWNKLFNLSDAHGVSAIALDGLQKAALSGKIALPSNPQLEYRKFQWLGGVMQQEQMYQQQKKIIHRLASFYESQGVRMLLLKGYGLSLNYPVPAHRHCTDIDIYLFGLGEFADQMIHDSLRIEIKQNEDKHSTFYFEGGHVENHACFVNINLHPELSKLEKFFESDAKENSVKDEKIGIYYPSVNTNALFIPLHTAEHFVHGEANLRQLCDWATFLMANTNKRGSECSKEFQRVSSIDWDLVERMSKEAGFFQFLCVLNGIVKDYLGVPAECSPNWTYNKRLEERVLKEILHPRYSASSDVPLWYKVMRYFGNNWKYRMVFRERQILGFFRLIRSYLNSELGTEGKSVWSRDNKC